MVRWQFFFNAVAKVFSGLLAGGGVMMGRVSLWRSSGIAIGARSAIPTIWSPAPFALFAAVRLIGANPVVCRCGAGVGGLAGVGLFGGGG
jgi:hypothetical protein